ncbi:MAG: hypothetical protein K2N48_01590 [Muribaculaceae bacterium]|nr:hypothetical protein [Muribaculaceae bacterium]
MENLSETLKRQAEALNACKKGLRNFPETEQGMIERWKENLDFALENNFPSVEIIRDGFDRSLLHKNLIFVDEHINIDYAPNGVYVLNGACTGVLHFREWAAAAVYVRHESHIHIIADDFAKVFVRLYDGGEADVCDIGDSVVKEYDRRR